MDDCVLVDIVVWFGFGCVVGCCGDLVVVVVCCCYDCV